MLIAGATVFLVCPYSLPGDPQLLTPPLYRLSAAPRRGSSSFGAPPPPSAAYEEPGYSGSQPFSTSAVSDDVENPMQSGATGESAESQSSEADESASAAPRRSSATAPRLSVMSKLAAAKGRKSVAPPPPAAPEAQSDL